MIFNKITLYIFFFFLFCLNFVHVHAETLEDIEMENKTLQMEIDSIQSKILDLENNPNDDPNCADIRSELALAKSEAKEAEDVYVTGSETIKNLDKQITDLLEKEKELDKKIKKHKTAQTTTGVLGGVFGLAAGGIGLWSHFEKNKIARGDYTDPICVSKIFDKEKQNIFAQFDSEIRRKREISSNIINLIADAGANCMSCCPGKADECEKSSNSIQRELENKLAQYNKDNLKQDNYNWKYICENIMNGNYYNDLFSVYNAVRRSSEFKNNRDVDDCLNHIMMNYGNIAVEKTNSKYNSGVDHRRYSKEYLQERCADDFCSRKESGFNGYKQCEYVCLKTDFISYRSDSDLCREFVFYPNSNPVKNLKDACNLIKNDNKLTSQEKDRCASYATKTVQFSFDKQNAVGPLVLAGSGLNNCISLCKCDYGPVYGPIFEDSKCIDQCNNLFKVNTPVVPLDGKKEEDIKPESKDTPSPPEPVTPKVEKYCTDITEDTIRSVCIKSPYSFKDVGFNVSSVSDIFKSGSDVNGFFNNKDICESFKSKLKVANDYICNCYVGQNTAKEYHFNCSNKMSKNEIKATWKNLSSVMTLKKKNITEGECIDIFRKMTKTKHPTSWCN